MYLLFIINFNKFVTAGGLHLDSIQVSDVSVYLKVGYCVIYLISILITVPVI